MIPLSRGNVGTKCVQNRLLCMLMMGARQQMNLNWESWNGELRAAMGFSGVMRWIFVIRDVCTNTGSSSSSTL